MSESAQLEDGDSKTDEIEELVDEANMEMDVDAVFETYDANSDGRIEHSEYVEKHKAEVEGGGISAVIDRLLDDSPELRGQRLWVMFALSVLLVAAMNAKCTDDKPAVAQRVYIESGNHNLKEGAGDGKKFVRQVGEQLKKVK